MGPTWGPPGADRTQVAPMLAPWAFLLSGPLRRFSFEQQSMWSQPQHNTTWWRHQMETFSALLALCEGNPPVDSTHKGQWRGALMFSLICAWTSGWVNNCEAADSRRYNAHYDVTAMHPTTSAIIAIRWRNIGPPEWSVSLVFTC